MSINVMLTHRIPVLGHEVSAGHAVKSCCLDYSVVIRSTNEVKPLEVNFQTQSKVRLD